MIIEKKSNIPSVLKELRGLAKVEATDTKCGTTQPEIPFEIGRMYDALMCLQDTRHAVEEKLTGVCRATDPECGSGSIEKESSTWVGGKLQEFTRMIYATNASLRDLVDRCEL